MAFDECRKVIDGHETSATTREQVNDFSDAGKSWRQKYLYRRNELIYLMLIYQKVLLHFLHKGHIDLPVI
ncbi:hypothetical protein A9G41_04585 [Gilliamella sp. Nev5-1]|nr:hypothetical protein A9G40_02330 [Gilliamella apicola]OCG70509.1 hypothetical protein A9G41_04585 [Gilliamella apicola]